MESRASEEVFERRTMLLRSEAPASLGRSLDWPLDPDNLSVSLGCNTSLDDKTPYE